jgi:glycosyltransferase involved in cell wall biosynthesis
MSAGRIFGGAERSLVSTARRLDAHGWEVTITCPEGALSCAARRLDIAVVERPWRTIRGISDKSSGSKRYLAGGIVSSTVDTVANARLLADLVKTQQPHALVSNSLPTHLVVMLAGQLSGRPTVWYLRDIVDPGLGRQVLELGARSVDTVIAVSRVVSESFRHRRIVQVPEPIERLEDGAPLAVERSRPIVGYLGRLDPRKGVEDVFHAVAQLDAEALVAGAPVVAHAGYVDELHRLAERAAPGRIRFLGEVPSPWPLLGAVDVLLVPSRREPWGRVAAEALTAGVPVVAADAGGLPEIVRDGVDGFLYPPGDVAALVARVRTLLGDPDTLSRFSANARTGAHRFEPAQNAAAVASVLEAVVERHQSGAPEDKRAR